MFDGPDYPQALDEALFNSWMEKGRESKIAYRYLLVLWDEIETNYLPVFVENRGDIESYEKYGASPVRQLLVAAYDLYSESKIV